ncbi:Erythromycin esterase [Nostoc flagelliforme CCNUN1]|uniref:Erythromycin esterase n=1 Tax=Nostoc flagelliforme CCNUN1 TaxID=2038116 RepID=A0A2K8SX75_9NOSO|nr:erythromycin esterase family protein [Nostoc flagelliforme]AUB40046.1 Erythromycin esterase [Nostoc flagelliforme CCNUN1]
MSDATQLIDALHEAAHPLTGTAQDYDPLMDLIGNARFVLIGEASHGTHEFYEQRTLITKRLIQEKGFTAIAVEADWPDAYRVNRYVRGINDIPTPAEALTGFEDFPAWMWHNTDVVNFIGWLRQYNDALPQDRNKVGFYGLDLYSMYTSISEVIAYLDKVDPEAAQQARCRYSCLEHFEEDTEAYGYAAAFGMSESCEKEVINQLMELQRRIGDYAGRDGQVAEDEFFYAQQNARLVKNAEEYYRSMFQGQVLSWNIRDRHMAETLDHLAAHLDKQGNPSKIVVWAHNTHLGYVRATDMGIAGELNVGQLVRDKYGDDTVLVGFTTYTGTVTAASLWGGVPELKQVRPALSDSYEALFHEVGLPQFLLNLRKENQAVTGLEKPRLERAIGVIYQPETERKSHYFYARLPDQFDAVIHIDDSRGVQPIDCTSHLDTTELPETFPFAV